MGLTGHQEGTGHQAGPCLFARVTEICASPLMSFALDLLYMETWS